MNPQLLGNMLPAARPAQPAIPAARPFQPLQPAIPAAKPAQPAPREFIFTAAFTAREVGRTPTANAPLKTFTFFKDDFLFRISFI